MSGSGKNLVGHAGAVLLRACADRTGLTSALSAVLPSSMAADWWDRGVTMVGTAVAIVLGAVNLSDVERLWWQQAAVFGAPASDSTIGRTLAAADDDLLAKVARARARVRAHVWTLLRLRPGGFPWLVIAGKRLTGWMPNRMRLLVRRTRPSRRHLKKLTAFERATGWRYQIVATDITRMCGIAGSHQPQWLDVVHRAHAGVEDRVRTNKNMGLAKLPSSAWTTNRGWVLAANLAADLDAWTRLLGLHDVQDLADAEPDTLRYRLLHLPAKLTRHARRRHLAISRDWPWREAFLTCWNRLTALPPAPA